jgi:predicted GNAT family acetyltransferase
MSESATQPAGQSDGQPDGQPTVEVVDAPERFRYEGLVDGAVAGYAAYRLRGRRIVFTHTEVKPEFEGKGVGSALAKGALEDVRRRSLEMVLLCPFMTAYVQQHPEYADLIAP